jgi:predicted peptidase
MGVLDLIARYPEKFAAGLSICGAGDPDTSKRFSEKVSLWLFHGDKDSVVPVYFSRNYFKRLQKLKADVKYSEYPGVDHDSWNNAFQEPELMSWLFSKQKK